MPYVHCGRCRTTNYVATPWLYAVECPSCGSPDVRRLQAADEADRTIRQAAPAGLGDWRRGTRLRPGLNDQPPGH